MNGYFWAHIVHLFCAIMFVGGVFFEALVVSAIHGKNVPTEARKAVEPALSARAVRVMPWVVGTLFASGLIMAHRYADVLAHPSASAFGMQLTLKITLACSILIHFAIAVYKMKTHTLTRAWSRYIHRAVLVQMVMVVLLAKTMFAWSWQ